MKRLFDFLASLLALLTLVPVLLFLYVLIAIKMGRPVIFVQTRPGIDGNPFNMMKFRSMTDEKDANGELLADEQRLPAFGQFLRSSSLDELPGLINVLRGDMSLVGPRPLLMEYLPLYNAEQIRRHDLRPGITGWAQVNGRNTLSWEKKFEYDVWYVDNQSFWLDIKILFMTVLKVVKRSDINQQGEATMTRFTGSVSLEKSIE
ncbi:MAG: lipopolysaccharide/colanic/teichoic acid biosynthesis glycosyltransferase [Paraglaciecola sp.]|jgi:lipopolysaccharide/colanic/teichoic acid biosynthesis glycosyltransferase